jgi:hypothetical protein
MPITGVMAWQLNTGPFVDTDLNGDEIDFTRDFGPVTSDWDIVGTGDGKTDIFWRHEIGPAGELAGSMTARSSASTTSAPSIRSGRCSRRRAGRSHPPAGWNALRLLAFLMRWPDTQPQASSGYQGPGSLLPLGPILGPIGPAAVKASPKLARGAKSRPLPCLGAAWAQPVGPLGITGE